MTATTQINQYIAALALCATVAARAYAGDCGSRINVDCHTHKITIGNMVKTIDCGKFGRTPSTRGIVGGPHKGKIVKDGVDIRAPGMGQDGGGKVFHTPNPDDKSSVPSGQDTTKGCIGVDNETLEKLKTCAGTQLEIIGSNGSTSQDPFYEEDIQNDKNEYIATPDLTNFLKKKEKKAKKDFENEAKKPKDPPKVDETPKTDSGMR